EIRQGSCDGSRGATPTEGSVSEHQPHQPLEQPCPTRRVREPGGLRPALPALDQHGLCDAELAQALGAAVAGADAALLDAAEGEVAAAGGEQALVHAHGAALDLLAECGAGVRVAGPDAGGVGGGGLGLWEGAPGEVAGPLAWVMA